MRRLRSLVCGAPLLGPLGAPAALAPALLGAAALTAAAAIAPPSAQAVLGDVNCDGAVNATDAQVLANFLVGISTSVPCPQNADVNGDGQVNVADVLLILQLSKGLRTSFSYAPTQVLAIAPSSGTLNVLPSVQVSALFSNPVSTASLPGNFLVADSSTGYVSTGTFRCSQNGTTIVYTPTYPLRAGRPYVVTLSTGITDSFGNPLSTGTVSSFTTQPPGVMTLTSVNNSTATLNTLLAQPISVQLLTSTGAPAGAVPVIFTAQMGNGTFQPSGLRQVTILTDNNGNAALAYKTGTQAMVNTVSIFAVGFSTISPFQVQTLTTAPVNLRLYTGGNQTGAAGSVAPLPLVVQATDAGGDYVQGATVTFTVPAGHGSFAGQISSSVVTDSTGTAAVMFTFGSSSGTVTVSAGFPGMVGMAPSFTMHDILPSTSTSTYISGSVIDSNTLLPLTSVYVYLTDNPSVWERTDKNGNFVLPASTGPHVVEVDGFESGLINGQMYPTVSYPVNAVQGQTTGLGIPAMLPEMNQQSYVDVSDVQGGTLTIQGQSSWQVYIAPGQATFQNGSHTGRIYASSVPHNRIPMPVAGGKASRFDDTIQPPTVIFSPPVQVTFPNADALSPGSVTEIFTLDYVSGAFKRTGRAMVSSDGSVIQSLPGEGIGQGGWHTAPPAQPPPPGCSGGNVCFGNNCSNPTISGAGYSAQGIPFQGYENCWSFLLCGLPTQNGAADVTITCNGASPPITPAASSPPSNCPPPTGTVTLTLANPVIGVNQATNLAVSVTGTTDPNCQASQVVPVTINATDSNAVTIAGSLGSVTIAVPVNTSINVGILGNAASATQLTASSTLPGVTATSPVPITVINANLDSIKPASYGNAGADPNNPTANSSGYICLTITPQGSEQYLANPTADDSNTTVSFASGHPDCLNSTDEITIQSSLQADCRDGVNITVPITGGGSVFSSSQNQGSQVTVMTPTSTKATSFGYYQLATDPVTGQKCFGGIFSGWHVTFHNSTADSMGLTPNYYNLYTNEELSVSPAMCGPYPTGPLDESNWYIGVTTSGDKNYNTTTPQNSINDQNTVCPPTQVTCSYMVTQDFKIGKCTTPKDYISLKFTKTSSSVTRSDGTTVQITY